MSSELRDLGLFQLRRDSDTKWSEHLVDRLGSELSLNSYILYEFVIEKSHYVHQRHTGSNISAADIAPTVRETLFTKALHRITSTHSDELFY